MRMIAVFVAVDALLWAPISAYAESDIVGSWKQTAFYQKVVATGERRDIYGDKVLGRAIYTKEGTFCTMTTAADRKQAAPAVAEAEKPALFSSMFAYCGTYTVNGAKLSTMADTAWAPGWLSSPRDGKWEVKGRTLIVETTPFKSMRDAVEVLAIAQYERE
jgi:lipocalin-like protein